MLIDGRYQVVPVLSANVAAGTTGATNGATVDVQNNVGVAFHLNVTEAVGLTSAIMKLQTSPDDSNWTDATFDETVGDEDGDLTVTLAAVGSAFLSYSGVVQYVRAVVDVVATDVDFNVISTEVPNITDPAIVIPT